MTPRARSQAGFTLLEVLIALVIVSVGLTGALRAASLATTSVEHSSARVLASWVAEDRLAEHGARRSWPALGESSGRVLQAGREFIWRETVSPSSVADLRVLQVRVSLTAEPDYILARLSATLASTAPRKNESSSR